ncbi:hypothetical protein SMC26_35705 [Actinomadura fulvescens]|uniref:hypothetical protein n=1 Tax=Actinomadura fulvescens TaxID=46160 RepID=UPI0031DA325F
MLRPLARVPPPPADTRAMPGLTPATDHRTAPPTAVSERVQLREIGAAIPRQLPSLTRNVPVALALRGGGAFLRLLGLVCGLL